MFDVVFVFFWVFKIILKNSIQEYNLDMKKAFELRKIIVALFLSCFLIFNLSYAEQISQGVFQDGVDAYRKGDAQECYDTMRALKKKDPTNAYVLYYLAMASVKLGNFDEAKESYEQVVTLNQDEQLVSYAKEGIQNINNVVVDKKADKKESKKDSRVVADKPPAEEVNTKGKVSVSDDEVAHAIKVLREAGLLNVNLGVASGLGGVDTGMTQQNSELMNLNMMMGSMGGSKNSGMDMLPFLMMQQGANGGKSNVSPEVIQMMMNNAMLDGMSAFDSNNKDK